MMSNTFSFTVNVTSRCTAGATADVRHAIGRRHDAMATARRLFCKAVVGIDLGTTHSAVSIVEDGRAKVIPSDGASMLLPSLVYLSQVEDPIVGATAEDGTGGVLVDNIKRLMGRPFHETTDLHDQVSYQVQEATDGMVEVVCSSDGWTESPEQISAQILKVLKGIAEDYLQAPVDSAVITVPSHFSMKQRLAVMNAGSLAGLGQISLLQEPIAAAIAHGLGHALEEEPAILVVDIGGGTCDVSLLHSFEGILEVNAYDGDNSLGGVDLDFAIIQWWVENGLLPSDTMDTVVAAPKRKRTLQKLAERCKIALTSHDSCTVAIPASCTGSKECTITMSKAELQAAAEPFLQRLWQPLKRLSQEHHLEFAHYPDGDCGSAQRQKADRFAPPPRLVTQLLLVGGATKTPTVRWFLERITGCKRCTLDVDPEHCVAIGAALHAGIMVGKVTSGLEMADSVYVKDLQSRTTGFQM
eukprot:jgi/Ulvmu1/4457/UM002_0182.1